MSNSLRDLDRLEDRIRQHRQVDKSPVLIVEGPDDLLTLRAHLDRVTMFAADGKPKALTAVRALKAWGQVGVRAIVDADFDDEPDAELEGIVHTYEQRDLEAMLVSLGVLAHLLEHLASSTKLSAVGGAEAAAQTVIDSAGPLAGIRHASRVNDWGLRFDAIDPTAKANKVTLTLDVRRYAASLLSASDCAVAVADVVLASAHPPPDGRGSRGKDIAAFAGLSLRAKFASLSHTAVGMELIAAQIRSSGGFALAQSQWLLTVRESLAAAEDELRVFAA
ncbi:hypothetical protein ACFC3F_07225 [Microbacterium sp. NPDC055910]|uniref:hypothetical protein n=1 Tax=Microbacterium sp. NPDC055910 TaxID=3345659 RepID=UPI0035E1DAAA